jgi:hypothetical protein
MSKLQIPSIQSHLHTSNIYTQYGIIEFNYKNLLKYHLRYCGFQSCWNVRSQIFDMMLSQSKLISVLKEQIIQQENGSFPFGG